MLDQTRRGGKRLEVLSASCQEYGSVYYVDHSHAQYAGFATELQLAALLCFVLRAWRGDGGRARRRLM